MLKKLVIGSAFIVGTLLTLYASNAVVLRLKRLQQVEAVAPFDKQTSAPFLHKGDRVPSTTFHAGERIYISTKTMRGKECMVTLFFRIIQPIDGNYNDRVLYFLNDDGGTGLTPPGEYRNNVAIHLPSDLVPGHYFLERLAIFVCDSVKVTQPAPPLGFDIVP